MPSLASKATIVLGCLPKSAVMSLRYKMVVCVIKILMNQDEDKLITEHGFVHSIELKSFLENVMDGSSDQHVKEYRKTLGRRRFGL